MDIVEVQHLQLGIEHLGDALWGGSVGGLAAAALAEELGAVDNLGDGLAQPRGADDPDNVCRGGGNYRLPGGMRLERESLAAICLGQHIVKALRQLVDRLSGGGELACLRVQNTRLADASADKSRACLAGAAGNMRGPRLPRRGVQATARPVPWHACDGKHVRGGAEEHAPAAAYELETQHLQQRRLAAAADNRGNAWLDLERGGKVSTRRFHLFTAV